MKLGLDRKSGLNRTLRSWASPHDPSSGEFTYTVDTGGLPQRLLRKGDTITHRADSWNGVGSNGQPATHQSLKFYFTMTEDEITYSFRVIGNESYSKLQMSYTGTLMRFVRAPAAEIWGSPWRNPADLCDNYATCGPYGYCDTNKSPMCDCIKGFKPVNEKAWELKDTKDGCQRKTQLRCKSDKFHRLIKMKLPDTKAVTVDWGIGKKECQNKCLLECNCTAFAIVNMWNGAGSACLIWTGELVDIRQFTAHGQDLYVRLVASDVGDGKSILVRVIKWIAGVTGTLVLCFVMFRFWKRKQKRARAIAAATPPIGILRNSDLQMDGAVISSRRYLSGDNDDLLFLRIEFSTVVTATQNFSSSNKLGEGGYGLVYKGRLPNGTLIAVKRLSETSNQGTNEFKTEVSLIAKLQHINLVRLLGFCVERDEKILIYEYLENQSLDFYLFDKTGSSSTKLSWQQRFAITKGIARGIQYLHQDSRYRIIHRDLKASNILLDKDMIPKISDFGLARIISRNETEANTRKVVGTVGYMAPEYRRGGLFSIKSDVFSFGVLVLELLSGRRNKGFTNLNGDTSLLSCVWRNWEEGNWLETIDPLIVDLSSSSSPPAASLDEVKRCLQIGLLCVQENAYDRPEMSSVVMMLGSEAAIPQPKPSGYCGYYVRKKSYEMGSSLRSMPTDESWTVNQVTTSVIDPR
ncbi:PREDICTED: receptor-like serine/threonine-protein kinase SD1-8 [Camelina sativa]|uniref:Receptor-like serine/threonine-protein kinase SD1-8 n=1 Tax=Camelina sativa TaxID=90675 RepID=A0ABM1QDP4_CAMSA|nr:PREDICTED: receptor-like serine/threonine-protein kinase SD1-8 [Camelina sativa]